MRHLFTLFFALTIGSAAQAASTEERFLKACPELIKQAGVCECIARNYLQKVQEDGPGFKSDFELITKAYEGDKAAMKKLDLPKYAELGFMDEDLSAACKKSTKYKLGDE